MMRYSTGAGPYFALDAQSMAEAAYVDAAHKRYRFAAHRLDLLKGDLAARLAERARVALTRLIRVGASARAPLAHTHLRLFQRNYLSGVFLCHLTDAEAFLPFVTSSLLELRTRYRNVYRPGHYEHLFATHFPSLADVPHNSSVAIPTLPTPPPAPPASRHVRRWKLSLARRLLTHPFTPTALHPRKLATRLFANSSTAGAIAFLCKLSLFEHRFRHTGVSVDWRVI